MSEIFSAESDSLFFHYPDPSESNAFVSIQSRRRTCAPDRSAEAVPDAAKVNPLYGVQAWRSWVLERNKGPTDSEPQSDFLLPACAPGRTFLCPLTHCLAPVRPVAVKEDVLLCDSAELGVALSRFVQEVRRPNGETYGADSVFYLCLGIQQVTQAGRRASHGAGLPIPAGGFQV